MQEYKMVKQPEDMNIKLFPHQLKSIYDMEKLERTRKIKFLIDNFHEIDIETRVGILGDIPGYGKSFSIVGLILRDKMEFDEKEYKMKYQSDSIGNGLINVYKTEKTKVYDTTVIIASTSIITQWEQYFDYTDLAVKTITTILDVETVDPDRYNVVIVSPNRYNEFAYKHHKYTFKRFIYDEPTSVHIPRMNEIKASFYWFVSATYYALFNLGRYGSSKHWMKSIFGYINPQWFERLIVRNDDDFVKSSFKMPDTKYITHQCLNPNILNVIGGFIEKNIVEMIEAGDIKGAIQHLGGKSTDGSLIDIVTRKKNNELELTELKINYYKDKPENKNEFKKWTEKKEQLQKDITEIKEKYKNILKDECPICRCDLEGPVMSPCCQNIFCGSCLLGWLKHKNTCPMCRSKLEVKNLIYVNEDEKEEKKVERKEESKEEKVLSKPDTIKKIIKNAKKNNKDSKFIIFSSYDETFNIIRHACKEEYINVLELSGTKASKDKKLQKFKSGEEPVIFLNSRFNGAGINLEMTTDIILYHDMTEDLKTQIVGRANRMGRKFNLNIHILM
jgi:hypothetical protein